MEKLKPYTPPQLTMDMLTDDVLNTALDRTEWGSLTADAVRPACFTCLTTSMVPGTVLEEVHVELLQDPEFQADRSVWTMQWMEDTLRVVEEVIKEVKDVLYSEEIGKYRDTIDIKSVAEALELCGFSYNVQDVSNLVAAYMVGGPNELKGGTAPLLDEVGMSIDDLVAVAKAMM